VVTLALKVALMNGITSHEGPRRPFSHIINVLQTPHSLTAGGSVEPRLNRTMPHILLVEDELVLRTSLSFTLGQHGYRVSTAADGLTALRLIEERDPDLILLDLMLPGLDGIEVCRRLRRESTVPVIMLTALSQEAKKIEGLRIGADDYVTKPFSSQELIARVEAVLRRQGRGAGAEPKLASPLRSDPSKATEAEEVTRNLEYEALRLDLVARQAWCNGEAVNLSPKEFRLLWMLLLHQGQALSREQLIASVWGDEFMGDTRTLDVHIRWLREKIELDPSVPRYLVTVRRYGFRLGQ